MDGTAGWQVAIVVVAAVAAGGYMAFRTAGLQFRRAGVTAVARPGDPAESGLYGATADDGARVLDGFSYRVGARFAGRARVVVRGDRVTFCGPRGPYGLYWLWIWLQGMLLAAVVPLAVLAAVTLDWRAALWALGALIASVVVMAIGAGVWPGLGEVPGLETGLFPALEHAISDVRDLTLGPGWANGGLATVLLLYRAPIDQLATGHAVSWFGPDERGREVRYALHCYRTEDAEELRGLLSGDG